MSPLEAASPEQTSELVRGSTAPDPHTSALSPHILKSGAIFSTWWDASSGWQSGWFEVPGRGGTQSGSRVTAIARDSNHLDLFVVGTNGGVYSTSWNSAGGWSTGWYPLPPNIKVDQGAVVTAIARTSANMDLFVTDNTGNAYWISSWNSSAGWASSWTELGGVAHSG